MWLCVCNSVCDTVCVHRECVCAAVADLGLINTVERYKLRNNYSDTKQREIKREALGDYEEN